MTDDLEAEVARLLEEAGPAHSEELQELLGRAARMRQLSDSLDGELQERADAQYQGVAGEIVELLLNWRALGGLVHLATTTVADDTTEIEPTEVEVEGTDEVETERSDAEPARIPKVPAPSQETEKVRAPVRQAVVTRMPRTIDAEWWRRVERYLEDYGRSADHNTEIRRISDLVAARTTWPRFPSEVQVDLVEWCAARLRQLQSTMADVRIDGALRKLTRYCHEKEPGWCNGLAYDASPRNTWLADAEAIEGRLREAVRETAPEPVHASTPEEHLSGLDEMLAELDKAPEVAKGAVLAHLLRNLARSLEDSLNPRDPRLVARMEPHLDALAGTKFKLLRRAIREANAEEPETTDGGSALPADWPYWGITRGRRAVIVGGDPRERNRQQLQDYFELASLEWVPTEKRRNSLQSLRDRVRNGGVDLVILLRSFIGHDADDIVIAACKETGTDWALVDSGYGRTQVRLAIERYRQPTQAAATR